MSYDLLIPLGLALLPGLVAYGTGRKLLAGEDRRLLRARRRSVVIHRGRDGVTGRMPIRRALVVLALALIASPAEAQGGPDGRMRQFLRDARGYAGDETLAAFFSARGTFEWVVTTHGAAGSSTGRWRFATADLGRAKDAGPLCRSFYPGGDVIIRGTLMTRIQETEGPWRRVSPTRFVPRGASAGSPVFVEWRREDGRWVIAAFGDERRHFARVLGGWGGPYAMVRDSVRSAPLALPLPADAAYAPGTRWYDDNEPIVIGDDRFVKYGYPRRMEAGSLRRIGAVQGVGVYMERDSLRVPDVVFVPVSPDGMFQNYQNNIGVGCPD